MQKGRINPDKKLCHPEGLFLRGRLGAANLDWQEGHPSRRPSCLDFTISLLPHFGQLMIIFHESAVFHRQLVDDLRRNHQILFPRCIAMVVAMKPDGMA
jgi:hypothetical protein